MRKWVILMALVIIVSLGYRWADHHYTKTNTQIKAVMVPNAIDGVILPKPRIIANFSLTDHHNQSFTKKQLQGHWTMMFFGFTSCALVCPTTLSELNKMYQLLEKELPADKLPQVIFVTVDPNRDTLARLNEYVTAFNKNFIGVRANITMTVAFEKQLHIAAATVTTDNSGQKNYTINHSAEILVFNPRGELYAYLSYPHQALQLVKDYKLILTTA